MTTGSLIWGAKLDEGSDGSDTLPFPKENAIMTVYGGRPLSGRCRVGTKPAHQQRQSTWLGKAARVASRDGHDFEKNVCPPFLDEVIPINQRHSTTPRVGCKSVKEQQPLAFFLLFVHFLYRF
jgi:hypothetical protein